MKQAVVYVEKCRKIIVRLGIAKLNFAFKTLMTFVILMLANKWNGAVLKKYKQKNSTAA